MPGSPGVSFYFFRPGFLSKTSRNPSLSRSILNSAFMWFCTQSTEGGGNMYGILLKFGWRRQIQYRAGSQAGGRYAEALYQRLYLAGAPERRFFGDSSLYSDQPSDSDPHGYQDQRRAGRPGKKRNDRSGSDPPYFLKMVFFL